MSVITIPVYSEQDLTPRAADVIRSVLDDAYPEHTIKFKPYERSDRSCLVFGRAPHGATDTRLVYTYSIAQIMSKANAASVLVAGVRQFIEEPDPIPFREPLGFLGAADIASRLDPTKPTAIDIETDGLLGKTETVEEVNVISIAFYQEGNPPLVLRGPWNSLVKCVMPLRPILSITQLLESFEFGIYHNGKFDIRVLNRYFGTNLTNSFDTMLAHHVINHAAGDHKLKTLARRYLGAPEWEGGLGTYTRGGGHYELIPPDKLVEYNGWDVYWTYKLYEFLSPQIMSDEDNMKAFGLEMNAAVFLLDAEKYGIPFDNEYAKDYSDDLDFEIQVLLLELRDLTDKEDFNPNSPVQVKKFLADQGWFTSTTNVEELEKIIACYPEGEVLHTFASKMLLHRKASKIKGTYADGWAKRSREGRVHPTFLVHGTSTGRLSSTDPNAQNVPRDKKIRKMVRTHG